LGYPLLLVTNRVPYCNLAIMSPSFVGPVELLRTNTIHILKSERRKNEEGGMHIMHSNI